MLNKEFEADDYLIEDRFYDYYAKKSQSEQYIKRFRAYRDCILRVLRNENMAKKNLQVADIGCGAGTQSMTWAEIGHYVHALDVNEGLIYLAKKRALKAGLKIDFSIGFATELPWANDTMDVCLVIELLEHVREWEMCIKECARVLKCGGILYITTTNWICPIQKEFSLPLYSWYPRFIKRYFVRLAVTSHPEIVNFAKFPAINWFSYKKLSSWLISLNFRCLDRFDVINKSNKGFFAKQIINLIKKSKFFREIARGSFPGTIIMAKKEK